MTEMTERRAIHLKAFASMKSLGKTKAVTIKREEKAALKKKRCRVQSVFFLVG